ncbi:MAG: dihydrofolate reductase family protein [Ardenticatenaceae bacterium]|nr:dihydrofolate reductase family protein [Ardenticatenaceae bacterium]
MSISLDGYIAGPNHEDGGLHHWYFTASNNPADLNQKVIEELISSAGALVMGRRTYNMGDQYDGFINNSYKIPHFVLTNQRPQRVAKGDTQFVFVTDGVHHALQQAKTAAGEKDVIIGGGASTAQQFLTSGLVDEIQLHLVPILLGQGITLFDYPEFNPLQLQRVRVIEGENVTHMTFRMAKRRIS